MFTSYWFIHLAKPLPQSFVSSDWFPTLPREQGVSRLVPLPLTLSWPLPYCCQLFVRVFSCNPAYLPTILYTLNHLSGGVVYSRLQKSLVYLKNTNFVSNSKDGVKSYVPNSYKYKNGYWIPYCTKYIVALLKIYCV